MYYYIDTFDSQSFFFSNFDREKQKAVKKVQQVITLLTESRAKLSNTLLSPEESVASYESQVTKRFPLPTLFILHYLWLSPSVSSSAYI